MSQTGRNVDDGTHEGSQRLHHRNPRDLSPPAEFLAALLQSVFPIYQRLRRHLTLERGWVKRVPGALPGRFGSEEPTSSDACLDITFLLHQLEDRSTNSYFFDPTAFIMGLKPEPADRLSAQIELRDALLSLLAQSPVHEVMSMSLRAFLIATARTLNHWWCRLEAQGHVWIRPPIRTGEEEWSQEAITHAPLLEALERATAPEDPWAATPEDFLQTLLPDELRRFSSVELSCSHEGERGQGPLWKFAGLQEAFDDLYRGIRIRIALQIRRTFGPAEGLTGQMMGIERALWRPDGEILSSPARWRAEEGIEALLDELRLMAVWARLADTTISSIKAEYVDGDLRFPSPEGGRPRSLFSLVAISLYEQAAKDTRRPKVDLRALELVAEQLTPLYPVQSGPPWRRRDVRSGSNLYDTIYDHFVRKKTGPS